MAPTLVRAPTIAHTLLVTIPATTAGNCLVVCVGSWADPNSGLVSGMTLGGLAGNFGALVAAPSTLALCFLWADPACAGGQTALVVTGTNLVVAVDSGAITVYEFTGLAATVAALKDKTAGNTGTTGTAWSSGATATTANAVEVWVGVGNTFDVESGAGAPWTSTTEQYGRAGYQITAATGTATYSGTQASSGGWSAAVATLRQPSAAAAAVPDVAMAPMTGG